jgi:hypothetical protein
MADGLLHDGFSHICIYISYIYIIYTSNIFNLLRISHHPLDVGKVMKCLFTNHYFVAWEEGMFG